MLCKFLVKWFHFLWKLFECMLINLNLCKSSLLQLAGLFFLWKKWLLGFPAREKCLNWSPITSNKNIPKNPEQFPKNPGIKIWSKSRPGKSRDPGILQKSLPVPSRNEIHRNAGHCSMVEPSVHLLLESFHSHILLPIQWFEFNKLTVDNPQALPRRPAFFSSREETMAGIYPVRWNFFPRPVAAPFPPGQRGMTTSPSWPLAIGRKSPPVEASVMANISPPASSWTRAARPTKAAARNCERRRRLPF